MALSDYAHWNEDAEFMWWHEEGKHVEENEPYDPDEYLQHDPDPECLTKDDCLRYSCFSLPSATMIWECDICGRQFPEGHPEGI